ncbi:MAG: EamA family transporter, partial [Actinobacteria bacterium]|nr:EamA family transporter [Actinomycetota bacterium]
MARSLTRFQGSLVILACGVMFSFGPLTFRALQEADTWQYLFFRNVSAAGVSALIILLARRNLWRAVVAAGRQQWLAGFLMAAMFTLYVVALSRVTAAFVLLMQCASPFYAALFARIFLKEPVG